MAREGLHVLRTLSDTPVTYCLEQIIHYCAELLIGRTMRVARPSVRLSVRSVGAPNWKTKHILQGQSNWRGNF